MNLTLVITCIILLAIAYTDFKERSLPLYLLIGLLGICLWNTSLQNGIAIAFLQLMINTGLLIILTGALLIYYRVKERTLKGVINRKLGLGDIVFWVAIAPLFSLVNFILFFISSLLLILVILMVRMAFKKTVDLIPLAGYQALVLLGIIVINALFFHHNFSIDLLLF